MKWAAALLFAATITAADHPLYVFDNGLGRGADSIAKQVEIAQRTGYAGVFYAGKLGDPAENVSLLLAEHSRHGMKPLGIYTGMNVHDARPGYDPALPGAIQSLRGTGALIGFTVNGKAGNGDEIAVPVIREVADMAARAGLMVALYPHHGFHIARVEDALRLRKKIARPNVGIVFNLCHWLRSGDEANLESRLKQALPHTLMVSINGADHTGDWDRLIQTLDRGEFDVRGFVTRVRALGYKGPFGLQCYNVPGDPEENLTRSMKAWRSF